MAFLSMNAAQSEALQGIWRKHEQRPPAPFCETEQAALRQLLRGKASGAYAVSDSPGQLASYIRDQLSLPFGQGEPAELVDMLPEREKKILERFESHMLLSPEEMAGEQEKGFSKDMYMDPQIANSPTTYHTFLGDLFRCNLLYFTTTPRSQVGEDVKDFFYRLKISRKLGEYFSLPAVNDELLKKELGYLPEEFAAIRDISTAPIYPCMRVLPMGFAWSFHLAHEAHCELARRSTPGVPLLRDRFAAPVLGGDAGRGEHATAMLIYADNNNHLGVCRDRVLADQQRVMTALHAHGLDTHEEVEGVTLVESLGVRINGMSGTVQPTPKRDWRLDKALAALVSRPYITGEQLQVVVGHMTVRSLLHRGLMCVLRHSYTFIEQCYRRKTRLWKSVAWELRLFRSLMPLGTADMFSTWDGEPLCTDACLSGYAVMEGDFDAAASAAIGRQDERWRFKLDGGQRRAPRAVALAGADPLHDPNTVLPVVDGRVEQILVADDTVPEVPPHFLTATKWRKLWNARVNFKEPVHLIEARSVLGAVKHRCRDKHRHGKRILVLNDNMGVALAIQKGRCHSYGLMHIVRRISAHLLASGIRLSVRWVPSEFNVADADSRAWEPPPWERPFFRGSGQRHEAQEDSGHFLEEGGGAVKCKDEEPNPAGTLLPQKKQEPFEEKRRSGEGTDGFRLEGSHQVSGGKEEESSGETKKVREEKSLLQLGSVKAPQRRDYARRLEQFYRFVAHYQLPISDEVELDEALCDYSDFLYLEGEGHDSGEKLKAALEFERPEAARRGELHLPRFRRAMKGWRKMSPSQTRLPMIEFVKGAISAVMLAMGWKEMALYNEISFSTYARPGELLKVHAVDVVKKNQHYDHDVIILSPFERSESSKAGIYDEVLILDDVRMQCLGPLVVQYARGREAQHGEVCPLWSFSASQYLRVWRASVKSLGVEDLAISPYQNRHGGASRDHLLRLRSVQAIQRRGRWAADASARIYDKPGRLQQAVNSVSDKYLTLGEDVPQFYKVFPRYWTSEKKETTFMYSWMQ
ncbi:unnamed protein product, partial [Effrenium voratum]